ncbi:TA system toxin CbtA family protein [Kosakonia sp. MUSA4]|uniref:TA system toxin CbtA family protein n=1 Tax=Kosakonia sp. MUSA4 TaxID=2067958 RepID=UPI001599D83E|nr:TA system toxin CbtA family protein [Kosakonia sp. MUSA4]QJT82321.1 toxin [Kosakonia sp. MUSA4]
MKNDPVNPVPSGPASVDETDAWQRLLSCLLEQHFGLKLADTPFTDREVIREYIEAGIPLTDAVNFMVDRLGLVRISGTPYHWQEQTSYISAMDILEAMRAMDM